MTATKRQCKRAGPFRRTEKHFSKVLQAYKTRKTAVLVDLTIASQDCISPLYPTIHLERSIGQPKRDLLVNEAVAVVVVVPSSTTGWRTMANPTCTREGGTIVPACSKEVNQVRTCQSVWV